MKTKDLAAHIEALAARHGITVEYYHGGGRAFSRTRTIRIREVRGASTYFIALHELGHLIGAGRSGRKLEREAAAWEWALANAKRPPTPGVRKMIARSLRSYLECGRRDSGRRQGMVEPAPGHVFWTLVEVRG